MTHFSVIVVGPDPEKQLAPFQENNMGNVPEELLTFVDQETEMFEQYKTEGVEKIKAPDGSLYWSWDDKFRVPGTIGIGATTHAVPVDHETVTVPFKELYSTFELFAHDYCGYEERDSKKGRYGFWENESAKWDWYQLGGRWAGFFPLKPGAVGTVGSPGLLTSPAKSGYADAAFIKDIDVDRAKQEIEIQARENFSKWRFCFENFGRAESFLEIKDRICKTQNGNEGNGNMQIRKIYAEQTAIVEFNKISSSCWGCPVEIFGFSEEDYVTKQRQSVLVPFALLKDGKWYEQGELGWGDILNETSPNEWAEQFHKLLNELPGDTLLSLYDCHT